MKQGDLRVTTKWPKEMFTRSNWPCLSRKLHVFMRPFSGASRSASHCSMPSDCRLAPTILQKPEDFSATGVVHSFTETLNRPDFFILRISYLFKRFRPNRKCSNVDLATRIVHGFHMLRWESLKAARNRIQGIPDLSPVQATVRLTGGFVHTIDYKALRASTSVIRGHAAAPMDKLPQCPGGVSFLRSKRLGIHETLRYTMRPPTIVK